MTTLAAALLHACPGTSKKPPSIFANSASRHLVRPQVGASPGLESAPDRRHAAELLHVCLARNNLVACRNSCNAPVGGKTPTSSQATESDARERVQATLSACIVSAEASLACLPWLLSRLLAFVKAINRYVSLDSLDPQSMALVSATVRSEAPIQTHYAHTIQVGCDEVPDAKSCAHVAQLVGTRR